MAGSSPLFDAEAFRDAIHSVMEMGMPPDVDAQPVFVMPGGDPTYEKNGEPVENPMLDSGGNPLDPSIKVIPSPGTEVSVPCAIQVSHASESEVATQSMDQVGVFRAAKAEVTLLDDDWAQVQDATHMRFAGNEYVYGYTSESLGLFDVGVTTMVFYAKDEK